MKKGTWEEYGNTSCVYVNYRTGAMYCKCCGTEEVLGDTEPDLNSALAVEFRIKFEEDHRVCKTLTKQHELESV